VKHDIVAFDHSVQPLSELQDHSLKRCIFEGNDVSAVGTQEMVMMVPARVGRLKARRAVADIDALNETKLNQDFKHPIDARDADCSTILAKLIKDLLRSQTAFLGGELLHNR
jgi:hypothetical protein